MKDGSKYGINTTNSDKELLLKEYDIGTQLYIYEDNLRWWRFTTLMVIQGTLLAIFFSSFRSINILIKTTIIIIGILFSIFTLATIRRSNAHFKFREERMKYIERRLDPSNRNLLRIYRDRISRTNKILEKDIIGKLIGKISVRYWMIFLCTILILIWVLTLILTIFSFTI